MRYHPSTLAILGELLTRDRPSALDPYVRWVRTTPAVLAIALAAAVLCGLYLHPRAFVLAAALAAMIAIGIAWPWASVRGLHAKLGFGKHRVREGESVSSVLRVRNRLPWPASGLAVRSSRSAVLDGAPAMPSAAGWSTTEVRSESVPLIRGEYPGPGARIATAFPFGIFTAAQPLEVSTPLLVWPRTFPVGPIPELAWGREGEGLAPRRKAGTSGDLLGVRPSRRGDSLRRVHWPQSARQGHLIVCELEAVAVPSIQIVLDAHPAAHDGTGPDGSLEWAVRIAASFAEGWIDLGAAVEIVHGDRSIAATSGPVGRRKARVLDALARLGSDGRQTLDDVLGGPRCMQFAGGLRIVVTTDRALHRLATPPDRAGAERFVVLHAGAFAGVAGQLGTGRLARRPWLWIDGPSSVPDALRRGWKEAGHAH
ncbi:MAG: DUF58 domain-containing protein [Isosphaeraceae bacterium]